MPTNLGLTAGNDEVGIYLHHAVTTAATAAAFMAAAAAGRAIAAPADLPRGIVGRTREAHLVDSAKRITEKAAESPTYETYLQKHDDLTLRHGMK